jgi:hypothetical protein
MASNTTRCRWGSRRESCEERDRDSRCDDYWRSWSCAICVLRARRAHQLRPTTRQVTRVMADSSGGRRGMRNPTRRSVPIHACSFGALRGVAASRTRSSSSRYSFATSSAIGLEPRSRVGGPVNLRGTEPSTRALPCVSCRRGEICACEILGTRSEEAPPRIARTASRRRTPATSIAAARPWASRSGS